MKKNKLDKRKEMLVASSEGARVWLDILGWATLAWGIVVILRFDRLFPSSLDPLFALIEQFFSGTLISYLKTIPQNLKSTFWSLVIACSSVSLGLHFIPISLREKLTSLELALFAAGLGLLSLSLLIFILGYLKLFYWEAFVSFFGLLLLSGLRHKSVFISWKNQLYSVRWKQLIFSPVGLIFLFFVLWPLVMSFVPEVFYDSLVYHMGLPQMYVNEGKMLDTSHVFFSRMPFLVQMLYVPALSLDSSCAAKQINFFIMLLGIGACYASYLRLGYKSGITYGLLFYISMPVVQYNLWSTQIDSAMASYSAMAFLSFLVWKENSEASLLWSVYMGLLCGAVFACKYTGVLVGGVLGLFSAVLLMIKKNYPRLVSHSLIFGFFLTLIIAPFLIKNYFYTGNPVFPMASNIFETRNMSTEGARGEIEIVKRYVPKSFKEWVFFPWKQTFFELSSFNFIGPMTLAGLPFLFFLPYRKNKSLTIYFAGIVLYFLLALNFFGDIRFLLPGFILLSVMTAAGLESFSQSKKFLGYGLKVMVLIFGLYNIVWNSRQMLFAYDPVPVLSGQMTRLQYSATMHNGLNLYPWNVMYDTINNLPRESRVYIVGNEQVFGFPKRFWYSSVHDDTPLVLWANESKNPNEFIKKIKQEGFTHLLVNYPETLRLKGYHLFPWTSVGKNNFLELVNKHFELIDVKPIENIPHAVFLFRIVDAPAGLLPMDFEKYFKEPFNF